MSGTAPMSADAIVAHARSWLGTPYHHQACVRGVGCDCLGLVRGVWREIYGVEPNVAMNYSRDWAEASGIESMLDGASRHMTAISSAEISPGDVVVFRLRPHTVAKHAGIVTSDTTMIHAMEGGPVSEVALSSWWRRRIAGQFRFPHSVRTN